MFIGCLSLHLCFIPNVHKHRKLTLDPNHTPFPYLPYPKSLIALETHDGINQGCSKLFEVGVAKSSYGGLGEILLN